MHPVLVETASLTLYSYGLMIAAGIVAGHINECGAQASGGNCLIDWRSIPSLETVGYPIIEAEADGSFVVTKHDGSGGWVTRASVTEQLLYHTGAIRQLGRVDHGTTQTDGLELERELIARLFASADAQEGLTAFIEKRKPQFSGK